MSESGDFIEEFKVLIQQNKVAQVENEKLRLARQELEKELTSLSKKIDILRKEESMILAGIEKAKQDSLKNIDEYKTNTDRVFAQEIARVEKQCQDADKREAIIIKTELFQKQRTAELLEWEDRLIKQDKDLKELSIKINCLKDQVDAQKNDNATQVIYIKRSLCEIEQGKVEIENSKIDLASFQEKVNVSTNNLRKREKELSDQEALFLEKEKRINEDAKCLKEEQEKFSLKCSGIDLKIEEMKKLKKDLSDKENALRAKSLDIDFKIARLESTKK